MLALDKARSRRIPSGDVDPVQTRTRETKRGRRNEPAASSQTLRMSNARREPTFPILVSIIGPGGLTAEFGMGSGVTPRVWAPGKKLERGFRGGIRETPSHEPQRTDAFAPASRRTLSVCLSRRSHDRAGGKVVKPIGQLVPVR